MGDARHAFLTELIDDAGLFPPASLSMERAAKAHGAARNGPYAWMLARFICPASRLAELAELLPEHDEAGPWRLSVILDGEGSWPDGPAADLAAGIDFQGSVEERGGIELVEAPLPEQLAEASDEELDRAIAGLVEAVGAAGLPAPVTPFLEIPADAEPRTVIAAIGRVRATVRPGDACRPPCAKLRCGGSTADMFPAPGRVASFLDACRRLSVPCKATAGLHHPFRHVDAATGLTQHGFVNLAGAAILARSHDLDVSAVEEVVADEDPESFTLSADGFGWRGLWASAEEIASARRPLFVGYGSCSFDEPVEDLRTLGVLD